MFSYPDNSLYSELQRLPSSITDFEFQKLAIVERVLNLLTSSDGLQTVKLRIMGVVWMQRIVHFCY